MTEKFNIKAKRDCGIEILRFLFILAIFWQHLVPFLHFPIGVPGFFLISGFFLIESRKNRFFKTFITTFVYSLLGLIIFTIWYLTKLNDWNPINFFTNLEFFHDKKSSWWFLYIMLALTLIMPLINKSILDSNKYLSLAIIVMCSFLWIFLNGIPSGEIFYFLNFKLLAMAVILYSIAGWYKIHIYKYFVENKKIKLWALFICAFIIIFYIFFCLFFNKIKNYFEFHNIGFSMLDIYPALSGINVFTGLSLITLFSFFKLKKSWQNNMNNFFLFLGKISLPIYLFHGLVWEVVMLFANSFNYQVIFFICLPLTIIFAIIIYYIVFFCEKYIDGLIKVNKAKKSVSI